MNMNTFDQDYDRDSLPSLIPEMSQNMDAITYAQGIGRVVMTILGWIKKEDKEIFMHIVSERIASLLRNCPSSMKKAVQIEIAYITKNLQEKSIIISGYPEFFYLRWIEALLEENGVFGEYSQFYQKKGDISNIDGGLLRMFLNYSAYYAQYSYRGFYEYLTACIYVLENPKGLQAVLGHMEDVILDGEDKNEENKQFLGSQKFDNMIRTLMTHGKSWNEAHAMMDAMIKKGI